jgi:hypothetical protein
MSGVSLAATSAQFVAGLALVALAGMIWLAMGRAAGRAGVWGLASLAALGLAEWCSLAIGLPASGQLVRLALVVMALVGLVELGSSFISRRGGLLPRRSYLALAGLAAGPWVGLDWLELGVRLAVAWQIVWLTVCIFRESDAADSGPNTSVKTIALGLVVYAIAACAALPLVEAPALVVATATAWLTLGPAADAARQNRLAWRLAWPAGFLLIAVGGCSFLAVRGPAQTITLAAVDVVGANQGAAGENADRQDSGGDDPQALQEDWQQVTGSARQEKSSSFMRQAKRLGMGIGPIAAFVLLVWGLSRLPFMH